MKRKKWGECLKSKGWSKRIFVIVIAVFFSLANNKISVEAASDMASKTIASGTDGGSLKWTLTQQGVLYISGTGKMQDWINEEDENGEIDTWVSYKDQVKEVVIGKGVVSIGKGAFRDFHELRKISFSNTVKSIGNRAFKGVAIEKITIPQFITYIEDYAFVDSKLKSVTIRGKIPWLSWGMFCGCKDLEKVVLPTSIKEIQKNCFTNCESLEEITIPAKVSVIRHDAFSGCTSLRKVTFEKGSSIEKIKARAFVGCKIKVMQLPKSVDLVGEGALAGCCEVQLERGNKTYSCKDGVLFSKDGKTLIAYPGSNKRTSYHIPKGVKKVGNCAFYRAKKLQKCVMSNTITKIGEFAFYKCTLKEMKFSSNLEEIEVGAFQNAKILSYQLPVKLKNIEGGCLGCGNVKGEVVLPPNITKLNRQVLMYINDKIDRIVITSEKLTSIDPNAFYNISGKKIDLVFPVSKQAEYEKMLQNVNFKNDFNILFE